MVSAAALSSLGFPAGSLRSDRPPAGRPHSAQHPAETEGHISPGHPVPLGTMTGPWASVVAGPCGACSDACTKVGPAPRFCLSGVPVSSRVSAKIQQLVNTLKRPKRPPLREFFVDDFEELLEGESSPHRSRLRACGL